MKIDRLFCVTEKNKIVKKEFDVNQDCVTVFMDILGKLTVSLIVFIYFILGDINIIVFGLVLVDIIYVGFFIEFLLNYKKV